MGQKTNPIGFRLGITKSWNSSWFDEKNFAPKLEEDLRLRCYIRSRLNNAAVSKIEIERTAKRMILTIHTCHLYTYARPRDRQKDIMTSSA